MHWIALQWQSEAHEVAMPSMVLSSLPSLGDASGAVTAASQPLPPLPSLEALGWWALQYTPRVVWIDEALMLEVSTCERLWGGRRAMLKRLREENPTAAPLQCGQGATSRIALALLRLRQRGEALPAELPSALPLDTLREAGPHLELLARLGCRNWGDVAALPRGGLARRFGKALGAALDAAFGLCSEQHRWLSLPEVFERRLELPALATGTPTLMGAVLPLLVDFQLWLRMRQCGVLALTLEWTHDLRRVDGVELPPTGQLVVRTAEPTQDMAHLRRLMAEQLARISLAAPASWLTLRSLETRSWTGASISFLPEIQRKGDRLHQLVERLSARLGESQVLVPQALADHRPECMQQWRAARGGLLPQIKSKSTKRHDSIPDALYPPWLLRQPLPLSMRGERPYYLGVLRQRIGPQRLEAGWWSTKVTVDSAVTSAPALRDYYVAESPGAGLVWIYCERPLVSSSTEAPRWFLQGLYA
ncbi:MAG: DNA polymerase Y family protein [Variovorax sp.]